MNVQQDQIPAVLIGGHTVALGVLRALYAIKVPVIILYYDHNDMGQMSRYVTYKKFIPHPEKQEEAFIEALLNFDFGKTKCFLIPTSDAALSPVSRNKKLLEQKYIVGCTEWEITQRYIDKRFTYELAERIGVPAPKTILPTSLAEVKKIAATFEFPCLVKPCQSHLYFDVLRKKMAQVNNPEELIEAFTKARNYNLQVMVQEIIPGDAVCGANYNSYFWNGEPLLEFTAHKVRNAPPDYGSPCVVKSEWMPEIIEPGRKILNALNFYGFSCTEFKRDPRDGIFKLMEVNGRHNLSSALAVKCGMNFPLIHYLHLVYGHVPNQEDFKEGIYWIDITRDLAYHSKQILKNPNKFFAPYINKHVFAILSLKDPKPIIKRCIDLIRHDPRQHSEKGRRLMIMKKAR